MDSVIIPFHFHFLEMWQTNFASKQLGNHRYPKCQHEHNVRDSDLMGVGQLIGLAADLVDVEAQRKDDGGQTEENHCDM